MRSSRNSMLKRIVAVIGIAVLCLLGVATSASAHGNDGGHHHRHGHSALQRFTILQTDPDATTQTVIAVGPIHARGTDTVVDDNDDIFTFAGGTLRVHHVAKHTHDSFDPVTCYGTSRETGTYRVTGGTGHYAHAHGHGTYRVDVTFVGCDENAPPEIFMLVVHAHGPLHV